MQKLCFYVLPKYKISKTIQKNKNTFKKLILIMQNILKIITSNIFAQKDILHNSGAQKSL